MSLLSKYSVEQIKAMDLLQFFSESLPMMIFIIVFAC